MPKTIGLMRATTAIALCLLLIGCGNEAVLVPVAAGSWFNFDRRPAKTIVEDQAVTVKANLALAKNKPIWKASHVSTLSYNNSILLVGQTKEPYYKHEIEKIVHKVSGVSTIYNQITVGCPIPLSTRTNDTWLTAQVKARILSNRNVGMNRVKVITEDSVVYLMGALTEDEAEIAIRIA
ncbi:MAG TPA: BON domain-containing protein, partial [Gammaproteobacteria bacterium]|nr:BON domain-containing protein [Gammaproteobacteria bacterium]